MERLRRGRKVLVSEHFAGSLEPLHPWAPILSPRILHISVPPRRPPAPAGSAPLPPSRRARSPRAVAARAARRPAAARRVEAQLHVDVLGPRRSSRPGPSSWARPRRATHAARSRRARASGAARRRAAAATRERERARQLENSLGECSYVQLAVFYLQGARAAQLRRCALVAESTLLLGAARIRSAIRAAAAEIDHFAFFARTCARPATPEGSRSRLLELASAAPLLSFVASASLRSSSARNFARSSRPRGLSSRRPTVRRDDNLRDTAAAL